MITNEKRANRWVQALYKRIETYNANQISWRDTLELPSHHIVNGLPFLMFSSCDQLAEINKIARNDVDRRIEIGFDDQYYTCGHCYDLIDMYDHWAEYFVGDGFMYCKPCISKQAEDVIDTCRNDLNRQVPQVLDPENTSLGWVLADHNRQTLEDRIKDLEKKGYDWIYRLEEYDTYSIWAKEG